MTETPTGASPSTRGLLSEVPDPTRRSARQVDRQILAFDPARSSLVELTGDLGSASSVGVLVPGLNTTMLDSGVNTDTVRRFVAEGRGDIAMITYLGGPFPTGQLAAGVLRAADPGYALDMAPRLVAFSEDVNRTVDATGRAVAVTYIGHSYGGSILGTAERLGLTADRTVYVEAAGAGVGVYGPDDWHNRNPDVARFSMTAPGDPIGLCRDCRSEHTAPTLMRCPAWCAWTPDGGRTAARCGGCPHTAPCSMSRQTRGTGCWR